jgi:hypothetical protein
LSQILLSIANRESLPAHPIPEANPEGFVIENLLLGCRYHPHLTDFPGAGKKSLIFRIGFINIS